MRLASLPLLAALVVSACSGQPDEGPHGGGPVLATVNGRPITEQDFVRRVRAGGPSTIARARTRAGRREILEQMIRTELLWQEAQKRGIRDDRTVRDAINPMLVKRLLAADFERTVSVDQVPESEVERIYRERYDEFHFPEVFRLGVMKLHDHPAGELMMKRLAAAGNNEDAFEILASGPDNLDERMRANEGNIGYLPMDKLREAVPTQLREHFERIKDTDEKPILVDVADGTYILMMTGHREPVTRALDDVRQGLKQQAFRELREKKLNEFVAGFRPHHHVSTYYDRLDFVTIQGPRRPPRRDGEITSSDGGGPPGGRTDGGAPAPPGSPRIGEASRPSGTGGGH
jgi:peptidyl-prolyl cis-trans isomerase C